MAQEAIKREDLQEAMQYSLAVQGAERSLAHAKEKLGLHVKFLKAEYSLEDGDNIDPKTGNIIRKESSGGNPSPEIAGS